MNQDIIPIFYDHSNKGILVYWKHKECTENGAKSIVDICKENNISDCYSISKNFYTFIEAWDNLKEQNINFHFGLEILLQDNHKIVVWLKSENAYKSAIKLYSIWKTKLENKVGDDFLLSYKDFNEYWKNEDFMLMIPYFDSFLYKNLMTYNNTIIPDFSAVNKENIFVQREIDSGLPFAHLIDNEIDKYTKENNISAENILSTKSCFYYKKEDFKAFQVNQCIHNRSTYDRPNREFLCSNNFSFEDWQNLAKIDQNTK